MQLKEFKMCHPQGHKSGGRKGRERMGFVLEALQYFICFSICIYLIWTVFKTNKKQMLKKQKKHLHLLVINDGSV